MQASQWWPVWDLPASSLWEVCCLSLARSLRQNRAAFFLLQMYLSSRHFFYVNIFYCPLKQTPNHSGLYFYSKKKSLKMEYLKCPWGKFERETLIFANLPMWHEPIHIFFDEWSCQQCVPGRFWIWSASLGHLVLLIQQQGRKEPGPLLFWERANKKHAGLHADLDIIVEMKSIIHSQISPAMDQHYLWLELIRLFCQAKALYCVLSLKYVFQYFCVSVSQVNWRVNFHQMTDCPWQIYCVIKCIK